MDLIDVSYLKKSNVGLAKTNKEFEHNTKVDIALKKHENLKWIGEANKAVKRKRKSCQYRRILE